MIVLAALALAVCHDSNLGGQDAAAEGNPLSGFRAGTGFRAGSEDQADMRRTYRKIEYAIPMRDGVKLYTAVYVPRDAPGKHPILLERTPYSCAPYGPNGVSDILGSPRFRKEGYIFAEQDVRGQYMSEGTFVNVRPELAPGEVGIDESTDAYDTIDYLVKHVPHNNGAVGMWGISYPGFYAAAGAIHSHPALKAISPQAPVSDWFIGDDVHHNGAFFVQDNFDFSTWFDTPRHGPEREHTGIEINRGSQGAYAFFLKSGALPNLETDYLKGRVPYWNELVQHGVYDDYWKARSLPSHLVGLKCAVLVVGGWFDAEDMWGALNDYQAIKQQDPAAPDYLVMGPWYHGMWADGGGETFGDLSFGAPTSDWYRENMEFPFFEKYLRGQAEPDLAAATLFDDGVNQWRSYPQWPMPTPQRLSLYLGPEKALKSTRPDDAELPDAYENDPAHPTPYMADLRAAQRPTEYMIDDQRWAEKRPDVLTYAGEVLDRPVTASGPVDVDLWVSTSGTDADFVVKVIDVWPADAKTRSPRGASMAGYEQLVRADIMRGKFRNSMAHPEPFVPGVPTRVHFKLNDTLHTFRAGHRIMVQIQSSWFPLVDRNPNRFEDIYHARDADFQKATISVYHDAKHASSVSFGLAAGG